MHKHIHTRFLSFLMVGLFNTAVGIGVIAVGILAGLQPLVANALGFIIGLAVSFQLNSSFTFRSVGRSRPWLIARYLVAFLVAYGCNLVAVITLARMYPGRELVTHVLGVIPYTIVFFLLADSFVFGNSRLGSLRRRPGGDRRNISRPRS